MPDRTTGRRADKAVVTGDMAGDAADGCALETAPRIGGGVRQTHGQRQSGAGSKKSILADLRHCRLNPRRLHSFPAVCGGKIFRDVRRLVVFLGERLGADLGKRRSRRNRFGIDRQADDRRLA